MKYKELIEAHGLTLHGDIEHFAELVAAQEREACAKVCETSVWSRDVRWWQSATKSDVSVEAALQCAAAIRARSGVQK